jgi:LPXTG-motif cell wall-anchored protein
MVQPAPIPTEKEESEMTKRTKRLSVTFIALLVFAIVFSAPLAATYDKSVLIDGNDNGQAEWLATQLAEFPTGAPDFWPALSSLDYYKYNNGASGTGGGFTITFHSDTSTVDWIAPAGKVVYYVWVKQGSHGYMYGYKNGASSDTGLLTSTPLGGLSHVSFWYGNAPHTPTPSNVPPTPTVVPPTPTDIPPTPTDVPPTPTDVPPTPTDVPPTPTDVPPTPTEVPPTPTEVPPTPTEVPPTPTEVPPTPTEVPPTPTEVPPTPTEVPPTPTEVPPTPTEVPPTPTTDPTITIPEPTIPQTTITGYATITEPPIPKTGGADTNLLYLLGSALVAGGLMLKRRKNHN